MDSNDSSDAMLNRALKLAYFIHNDKLTALRIVASAMMRLETTAAAQDKRFYYTPIGRLLSDRLKSHGFRNKINLNTLDLLQLLVFIESEPYERRKEMGQGVVQAGEEDMIIHFIKHLVTITMKRNSFYVALGMCRLLHNYSTSETMDIYNVILQDPDRTKDDHYCRSRKGRLMQEMKQRFGGLITAGRGPHGEERFHSLERPSRYAGLVRECLDLFSPWRTLCPVPAGFNPTRDLLSCLSSSGRPIDEDHQTEVTRIHAIVHPECFTRLTRALAFDCPEERLALPRFFTSYQGRNGHEPPSDRRRPPELKSEDKVIIQGYLDEQAARRRAVTGRMFSIRVDGVERARLNLDSSNMVRVVIEKSANVIEVLTFDALGEVVLATHLLYMEDSPSRHDSRFSINLGDGREISFRVQPAEIPGCEGRDRIVDISYRDAASRGFMPHRVLQRRLVLTARARNLTALTACLLVLVLAGTVLLRRRSAPPVRDAVIATTDGARAPSAAADDSGPDRDRATDESSSDGRQPGRRRQRLATSSPGPKGVVRPDSIRRAAEANVPNPPVTDPVSASDATREPADDVKGASLQTVRRVYVECRGSNRFVNELGGSFTAVLEASEYFQISDPEHADAAFKVFETLTTGSRRREESTAGIRVQLVNRAGEILWQTKRSVPGGNLSGFARRSASDVVGDLVRQIQELDRLRK